MANRRDAFNSSMEDLKKRIQFHSSNRMRRPAQDPVHGGEHEEPDGDEDEQGREPAGPEEVDTSSGSMDLISEPEGEMEIEGERDIGKKWKKEANPQISCRSCNADMRHGDSFCSKCGDRR